MLCELLTVATSSVPSPSTSPQEIIQTAPPAPWESANVKVPSPFPVLTTIVWLVRAPITRSRIASSFMSAAASAHSPEPPPSKKVGRPKTPLPSLNMIDMLLLEALVLTMSMSPSPSASRTAMPRGWSPTFTTCCVP